MFISSLQQLHDSFQITCACICIVVENEADEEHLHDAFPTIGN